MTHDIIDDSGTSSASASGRFVLRLDLELHGSLRFEAHQAGLSLNAYCSRKLAAPSGVVPEELYAAVSRAIRQFGNALLAVLAYGSWARGEARQDSDLDLLIVVRPAVSITRSLYIEWDESPLHAFARRVEPSIANMPSENEPTTGLWAEVAMDGIVLLDPNLVVSRHLAAVRSRILSGEISRRTIQGQPYWVAGAPDG